VKKLNAAMNEGLATAEMKAVIAKLGAVSPLGPPEQFAQFIATQITKWRGVAKASNIKVD
jgi:tripartite-type tricarboxylate transporter receptor subunit TctC